MCDVTETDWDAVATAVKATQDDFREVLLVVNGAIRERVPEYTLVPDDELNAAVARNIGALLAALCERRYLAPGELDDFARTVEQRARNGVPIDEYLLAVSTAEASMWEQVWRRAEGVTEAQRVESFTLRFGNMNAITRVTVAAHRRIELVTAREDQERRALALRALLRGGLDTGESKEHLARLGLTSDRPYYLVRARARTGDSDAIPRALAGGQAGLAAFVLWGDDTVGLLRTPPSTAKAVVAGVAGPVTVPDFPVAHERATTAFETAWALGLEGSFDLPSLGLRAAVQSSPDVGSVLRDRYLAPLLASGSLGEELLSTTRAFLEAGSRRDVAAGRLHVHQNTVGYRLSRFTELTGADLSDLTTLAELHWLFTDLDLRRRD
ncbi:MAG: hypothetical protein JWO22_799 [Frankiales bacterium]|nr:hypothetical protein [Frankiales bacterium]